MPRACPSCGNVDLVPLGLGTQRLERALAAAFPQARIARVDRDSTRARHAFRSVRDQVEANAGAVKPSSLWQVAWWTGGGTPGSPGDNTVYLYGHTWKEPAVFTGERMKVLHAAVVIANELPRSKLLTFTRHGFMAEGLAMLRPSHSPILAFTPDPAVLRQLRLLRAVEPYLMPLASDPNDTIESAISLLRRAGRIAVGDKLVIASDIIAQDHLVDSVQLRTVR